MTNIKHTDFRVHIINLDRFREPRETPQYEGPPTDELFLFAHRLAKKIHGLIGEEWSDFVWRHKLTDPDWSVPDVEDWLCEGPLYTAISEAKRLEEDFEEGE